MLSRISLKFGNFSGAVPLRLQPGTMTIVVGPNNSGKSLFVQELSKTLLGPGTMGQTLILDRIECDQLTTEKVRQMLSSWDEIPKDHGPDEAFQFVHTNPVSQSTQNISSSSIGEGHSLDSLARTLLSVHTLLLDGRSRLGVLGKGEAHSLKNAPMSVLMALLRHDKRRARLRKLGFEAFQRYLVVDITDMKAISARMSERPPPTDDFERSFTDEAIAFMEAATPVAEFSDGIRAYLGILAAALCSEYQVILIDEPEAFLHPPLQRALGQELASLRKERSGLLIAATHSADFLMGCIQSRVPVNIVRLTYDASVATAMLLPREELAELCRNPLIRSSRFFTGLFHHAVVVCEGESDRVFYEEVLRRIGASQLRASDILTLNGLGKATIARLVGPLRRLGIPAAAVVDLDIVKEADLSQLLRSALVPADIVTALSSLKRAVKEAFDAGNFDPKLVGVEVLAPDKLETARRMISDAAEYVVFIVEVGPLENWLTSLDVSARKSDWLASVFDLLDTDRTGPVLNMEGDVWEFVRGIVHWIEDPTRKGMPVASSLT